MLLSDSQILDRVVSGEEWKEKWKSGKWDEIKNKILILPFDSNKIELNVYNLSIGDEYVSLRDPLNPKRIDRQVTIEPGETVLILTEEYIALPKNIVGLVIPKARLIFEGILINATRVDPTWYGKLLIAVTNITKNRITMDKGKTFCSIYFIESYEVGGQLEPKTTPSLGRECIEPIRSPHHSFQPPIPPEKVSWDDLDGVVETFGKPWDIVRGVIKLSKDDVVKYVEKEVAPNIVEEAKNKAYEVAYKNAMRLLYIFIGTIIGLFLKIVFFP